MLEDRGDQKHIRTRGCVSISQTTCINGANYYLFVFLTGDYWV